MDGLGGLIFEPLDGVVDVAVGVGQQQVRVGRFDRCGGDAPIGFGATATNGFDRDQLHGGIEEDGRVLPSFFGHSLADWVARVERVWLDEAELFVPSLGPMAAFVAGKPEAKTGNDDVVAEGGRHNRGGDGFGIKPRPMVAETAHAFEKSRQL